MNVFTEVYSKSVDLIKAGGFDSAWKDIESELKAMLDATGPDTEHAKVLGGRRT